MTLDLPVNPESPEPTVQMGRPDHRATTACPDRREIQEQMVKTESEAPRDAMDHRAKRDLLGILEMLVYRDPRVGKDLRVRWVHQVPRAKWD